MLGADSLAPAAADAVAGLFGVREVGSPLLFHGIRLAEHPQLVPDAEVVRDVHPHGAGHTVPAARAADLDPAVQDAGRLGHGVHFSVVQGPELGEGGKVVGELLLGAHAGEDEVDVLVAAHPAQRPRSGAGVRVKGGQRGGGVCREIGQRAALDGFHDDEGDAQFFRQRVAPVARDLLGPVVGVEVVVLQLAEVPRLVPQDTLQPGGVVVAGEAEVSDAAGLFLLPQPVHDAQRLGLVVPGRMEGVEQIEVDVLDAQPLELLAVDLLGLFQRVALPHRQLGGQIKALAGPLGDDPPHEGLAFAPMVGVGGVKVVDPRLACGVQQRLGPRFVDAAVRQRREPHTAVAQQRSGEVCFFPMTVFHRDSPFSVLPLFPVIPDKINGIGSEDDQRRPGDSLAQADAGGLVDEVDGALPGGAEDGHQTLIHPQDVGLAAVDRGSEAVVVGDGEEHEVRGVQRDLGVEAGVRHLEDAARRGAAVGAVLHVAVISQVVQLGGGQLGQVLAVGGCVLLREDQRPHQQVRAGDGDRGLIGVLGEVVVVGEAHGHIVVVFVEGEAVQRVVVAPAVVCHGEEIALVGGCGDEVLHAQQPPQRVIFQLRLAADIPLDAQRRIEAEDAGSRRAAEVLQAALVQPEAEVVVGLEGVDAPVAFGEVFLEGEGVGVFLHQIAVGVPLAELADADVGDAEQAAESQHRRQHPLGQALILPPAPGDEAVDQQPRQTEAENGGILAGVLQNTQRPFLRGGVLHRHQREGQRRDHQPADPLGRAVQLHGGVFQRVDGHGREDQHRHIEPPGVVAGIEGVERTVQHRHQRKDGAGADDPLFAVALPGLPVGHGTGQTAQGQVGRHARPLDDALRPDGGHIGRIRRQDPAQQDGKILLGFRVGQKAPAGGKVDGARVL